MTRRLQFLMNVNDGAIAAYAARAGVDRLFVDLEVLGKAERQAGMGAWQSAQTLPDVSRIREAALDAHLLVRVNPLNPGSRAEIDEVIDRGADSIMLPMFRSIDDARRFLDLVGGRAEPVPLVETGSALAAVPELAETEHLTRVHFGLNDLSLDLRQTFLFEPLVRGLLDEAAAALRSRGVPFGIGGLARWGEGVLPPSLILGEHVRLGSDCAILSRTFHRSAPDLETFVEMVDLEAELALLRDCYRGFQGMEEDELDQHHGLVASRVDAIIEQIQRKGVGEP